MKPPKGPFWAWQDIGEGTQWYICQIEEEGSKLIINYLTGGFQDYWYDDDWSDDEIVPIKPPATID